MLVIYLLIVKDYKLISIKKTVKLSVFQQLYNIFNLITSTTGGKVFVSFLVAVIIYAVAKLVIKFIDYLVFKHLMRVLMSELYEDEDDENEEYNNLPSSYQEDDLQHKKDKKQEQMREAEHLANLENDIRGGKINGRKNSKIVGLIEPKGYWTARVMRQMLSKMQGMDINVINEKGYWQAFLMAQRGQKSIGNDRGMGF